MTIEQAITQSLPGTGQQIADKASDALKAAGNGVWMNITPNIVYAFMFRNPKRFGRKLVAGDRGMVNYFYVK